MMGREAAADLGRLRRAVAQKYRQIGQTAARERGTEYGLGSWAEKRPRNMGPPSFPLSFHYNISRSPAALGPSL